MGQHEPSLSLSVNWNDLAAYFEQASERLSDWDTDTLLDHLRRRLMESVRANFEGSHAPDGTPWAPLARPRPGRKPLIRTGDLMHASIEAAWRAVSVRDVLTFDTDLLPDYWRYHQFGTSRIPARPFLGFPADVLQPAGAPLGKGEEPELGMEAPGLLDRMMESARNVLGMISPRW